ncbi:hypothetical protein RvY_11376, partial [Ramazzottius varieornatus]
LRRTHVLSKSKAVWDRLREIGVADYFLGKQGSPKSTTFSNFGGISSFPKRSRISVVKNQPKG